MAAVRQYNDSSNTATLSSPNPRLLSKPTVSVSEVPIDGDVEEGEIEESNEGMAFRLEQTKLISSPYTNIENQLDLQTLELHDRLFALALTEMQPTRPDYATAPWTSTFNWPVVFDALRKSCQAAGVQWQCREYYVVIFRSKLQVGANRTRLGLLDQKSHGEACASGGLLKYWFGTTDAERQNVATCKLADVLGSS